MTLVKPLPLRARMLSALTALPLVFGCSSAPMSPPDVLAPVIPPLPAEARQPPMPSACSPTCSGSLTIERARWQQQLTLPAPPASPASAPTMR